MCTMRIVVWLIACAAGYVLGRSNKVYINIWAVEIPGGVEQANAAAETHEFINKGQVGILENVFEFELPISVYKREAKNIDEPFEQVTGMLMKDNRVSSAEQQSLREVVPMCFDDPTDPKWTKQWFLFNNESGVLEDKANSSRDLNVIPAWIQGVTGVNVTVGVVDNGVEHNHTDIDSNYLHDIDINVVTNVTDAYPVVDNETGYLPSHGTKCAGIIAMEKNNDKCGVGVAFNAHITGIVLAGSVTDIEEARALGHAHDVIDIYSNSWGLLDDGQTVQDVGVCTEKTLEKACNEGRGGKGSIYVFASGNGGRFDDSCAANGYVNSIHTIAIGSANSGGGAPDYDEQCSGKMAVAFVHHSRRLNTATTDTYDSCVESFDGTSAATPVVSGTIALVLEVNPNLTWRDVQYLIAYTSNHDILTTKPNDVKMINGAGLTFSHQFGFGAVDAEAMVTRARHWTNVPRQEKSTVYFTDIIYVRNSSNTNTQLDYSGNISSLEHVVVYLSLTFEGENLNYVNRGDIQLKLISPQGTTSTLLPYRPRDVGSDSYNNWPFLSVHFWGENPIGNWALVIWNQGENGTVVASNGTVVFYGTHTKPQAIARIPEKCHAECSRGCSAPGPEYCDSCRNYRHGTTLECIEECSDEYTVIDGYCTCYKPASDNKCPCKGESVDAQCMCDESESNAKGLSVNTLLLMLISMAVMQNEI